MAVKWFCHRNVEIALPPAPIRSSLWFNNYCKWRAQKKKRQSKKLGADNTNAISNLTLANGKPMRNESEKTKIFQIKKFVQASLLVLFIFCLATSDYDMPNTRIRGQFYTQRHIYTYRKCSIKGGLNFSDDKI